MSDDFEPLRLDYLSYLASEKGLSSNTQAAYGRDLLLFFAYIKFQGIAAISLIDDGHIITFLESLQQKNFAASSISRALISVKSFFKFASRENRRKI